MDISESILSCPRSTKYVKIYFYINFYDLLTSNKIHCIVLMADIFYAVFLSVTIIKLSKTLCVNFGAKSQYIKGG